MNVVRDYKNIHNLRCCCCSQLKEYGILVGLNKTFICKFCYGQIIELDVAERHKFLDVVISELEENNCQLKSNMFMAEQVNKYASKMSIPKIAVDAKVSEENSGTNIDLHLYYVCMKLCQRIDALEKKDV